MGEPALHSAPNVIDFQETAKSVDTVQGDAYTKEIEDKVRERFAGLLDNDQYKIEATEDWVEITLPAQLLFESGSARFRTDTAEQVADLVAGIVDVIGGLSEPVSVEGFTDNIPSQGGAYPSNWELSAARASTVVRALEAQRIDPERLAAVGYGENFPLATNATPDGRAENRRVALVIDRSQESRRGRFRNTVVPVVLTEDDPVAAELAPVTGDRTEAGGLLFSNDP